MFAKKTAPRLLQRHDQGENRLAGLMGGIGLGSTFNHCPNSQASLLQNQATADQLLACIIGSEVGAKSNVAERKQERGKWAVGGAPAKVDEMLCHALAPTVHLGLIGSCPCSGFTTTVNFVCMMS